MSGVKRARSYSELGPRKRDGRKKEVSLNVNYWLGSKSVTEKTPEQVRSVSKKRRMQKEDESEIRRDNLEAYNRSSSSDDEVDVFESASSNEQYKRRMARSYMMELANYPHPNTYEEIKLLGRIEERLNIPKNSRSRAKMHFKET